MIRIAYISKINLLSGRTNVYNLAKTCEAINSQEDFEVILITTDKRKDVSSFFHRMGVKKPFNIVCLGLSDTAFKYVGRIWYEVPMFLLTNVYLVLFLLTRLKKFDAIYFRDESLFITAFFVRFLMRKKVFFEIHSVYERRYRQLKNKLAAMFSNGIIAISTGLENYYKKINKNIIVSLCSASEESWYDHSLSVEHFRKLLDLPLDAFVVGYAGVVGINPNNDYYEIDDIVKSLNLLPNNVVCVIVGELNGNAEWLREISRKIGVSNRIIVRSWQERSVIPKYLKSFDAILIPKRKKDLIGDSPAKMFPALEAGKPIIAGKADCIEEVLTNNLDSIIVDENSPLGWAEAILKVYSDHSVVEKILKGAILTKKKYTWEKRGANISKFVKNTVDSKNKKLV